MTVRRQQYFDYGVYFVTFTCYKWLSLIEQTQSYGLVYKWFDYLKEKGCYILGYVIMPNHLHVIIAFRPNGQSINTRIGNGKRFMAYGIVDILTKQNDLETLKLLKEGVINTDKGRGKLHQVFQPSFDCKECISEVMLRQKLDYIHNNPCKGKWQLVEHPADYKYSSAAFYYGEPYSGYPVTLAADLRGIDLSEAYKPAG